MRTKIAVITAQIEENMQKSFLTSFIEGAYHYDYDVCIFSMFQKLYDNELRNIGDSNIYELIQYDLFDAIMFMPDTILVPGLSSKLLLKIRDQFDGPVLVLDIDTPFFPSIKIDHYTPMKSIINHLIEEHHFKEIAFLGGKKGHPHSVQRYNAYLDSMREHNLPIDESIIYHGNYWYDSGKDFAMQLINREHLPEALACANDYMAIGAATCLTEHGIKIPKDIALTGYDSTSEGRYSPYPLTSANIPASEAGKIAIDWFHSALNNESFSTGQIQPPIFVGGSCGCHNYKHLIRPQFRKEWNTARSDNSYYSDFNCITDDLMTQTTYSEFYKTILDYTYQIKPFRSFHLCLNDTFKDPYSFLGPNALKKGYTDTIYRIIHCDDTLNPDEQLSFEDKFSVKELLPDIHMETEHPTCYIFNSLFFNDRLFGYTVISYEQSDYIYDVTFRVWMNSVMLGMESFVRHQTLQYLIASIKAEQIRDSLTGLYNYNGYLQTVTPVFKQCIENGQAIHILALDIQDLREINLKYGRKTGDKAILLLAKLLSETISDCEIACRMCNDEFLVLLDDKESVSRAEQFVTLIQNKANNITILENKILTITICSSVLSTVPTQADSLDYLINQVVSQKNHIKSARHESIRSMTKLTDEDILRNQTVAKILDENLLKYHFQPIFHAKDGSIYGYEALMRCDLEGMNPGVILEGAASLGRMYDIERSTFNNILDLMDEMMPALGEHRIFINSLPAFQLTTEDMAKISQKLRSYSANIVVEITEESEIKEEELTVLRNRLRSLNLKTALDDYGAGYSNINNLLRYMPNIVKIDRALISDIDKNPQKKHFVKSIIEFSHANQIMALAEGIETSGELRELIYLGIDLLQGYYTGRPKPELLEKMDDEKRLEIIKYQSQISGWRSIYSL